ncbi:MAG TPA: trypsin-like peptidase domain-containing protein, partial [Micromonosporaceae bacterium]
MSDELFWPPLSGSAEDESTGNAEGGTPASEDGTAITSELPTQPSGDRPTEPLAGSWAGTPPQPPEYGTAMTGGPDGRPPRRIRNTAVILVAVTAFVFGAGGVGLGAALVHDNDNSSGSAPTGSAGLTTASGSASALSTSPKSYAGIAQRVLPSVVSVNVKGSQESDTGSGIILRSDGYILTNNHVVAAAANGGSVSAAFNDGTTATAKIIGTDSLDDLAVIKVTKTGLRPATLGSDSGVKVGDPVLAVGSPLGLSGTVTSGIVSALNRPVVTTDESQQNPFGGSGGSSATVNPTVIDAIQTDAAINPGNSGGPLVNSIGQVIGVNSAIASLGQDSLGGSSQSGNIGVGFAIPIDEAKTIATELINTGKAVHPLLGVTLTDSKSSNGIERAIVHSVTPGGPAAKAGLKAGDVITGIDGAATAGDDAVIAAIRSHQPGEQVS